MKHLYKGLSVDERDALSELLMSAGWKPFLSVVDRLAADQEADVLRRKVEDGADKIIHAKLRADGARKLFTDIQTLKNRIQEPAK